MAEDYSTSDMKGSVSTADYLVHKLIQKQIRLEQFLISTSLTTLKRWLNKASCTRRLDGCRSKPNDTTVTDADEICLQTQEFTANHKTNCWTISTNFLILKFQLTLFGLAKYIVCRIFCTVSIVCSLTTQLRRFCATDIGPCAVTPQLLQRRPRRPPSGDTGTTAESWMRWRDSCSTWQHSTM